MILTGLIFSLGLLVVVFAMLRFNLKGESVEEGFEVESGEEEGRNDNSI